MPVEVKDTLHYSLHARVSPGGEMKNWRNMSSGEIGVINEPGDYSYNGEIVLKTYSCLASLSVPGQSWSSGDLRVRLLTDTDALTLIYKGR